MELKTVGLLHPGAMGCSVGAAIRSSGRKVLWVSEGRSAATGQRAAAGGFRDAGSLEELAAASDLVVSVCPPAAALQVAQSVRDCRFGGLYMDANAVSPDTARRAAQIVESGGASFVDGGIIGPPAWQGGTTRLYLSGKRATAVRAVAAVFAGSPLEALLAV